MHKNGILFLAVIFTFSFVLLAGTAHSSYTVTAINTTVTLNTNTSAEVIEVLNVSISNTSVKQYSSDRVALNLSLSDWQSLIGPSLVQHIINPHTGVSDFKFLPGPLENEQYGGRADIIMSYVVKNVTTVSEPSPRKFLYSFNPSVFNFEHGVSGEILPQNSTLNIVLPPGAQILSVYPIPDSPVYGFAKNYQNASEFSWFYGEPLSKFTLNFVVTEGLEEEVFGFLSAIYQRLGVLAYIIIAIAIISFVAYTYYRATK